MSMKKSRNRKKTARCKVNLISYENQGCFVSCANGGGAGIVHSLDLRVFNVMRLLNFKKLLVYEYDSLPLLTCCGTKIACIFGTARVCFLS